jgi:hypothetical protein
VLSSSLRLDFEMSSVFHFVGGLLPARHRSVDCLALDVQYSYAEVLVDSPTGPSDESRFVMLDSVTLRVAQSRALLLHSVFA